MSETDEGRDPIRCVSLITGGRDGWNVMVEILDEDSCALTQVPFMIQKISRFHEG